MKSILTIDCGNRSQACAQGLACAIFNADEMDILHTGVGSRYEGPNVNIVVDDVDFKKANPKQIFSALSKAMDFVIKASKEGFDGNIFGKFLPKGVTTPPLGYFVKSYRFI